jgi:hypothetical protein
MNEIEQNIPRGVSRNLQKDGLHTTMQALSISSLYIL